MRKVGEYETVLVTEYKGNRVSEFQLDGTFVKAFGCCSFKEGQEVRKVGRGGAGKVSVTAIRYSRPNTPIYIFIDSTF
jgi:hypothetical protein